MYWYTFQQLNKSLFMQKLNLHQFPCTCVLPVQSMEKTPYWTLKKNTTTTSPYFLRWSTLQNNGCSTYPLTDHLMTVILHPVCITAHNCLFKSATTAVTIAIILISSQLRVHSCRTSKLCDNNMHIMQWEDELLLRTNANDCLHIWLNR